MVLENSRQNGEFAWTRSLVSISFIPVLLRGRLCMKFPSSAVRLLTAAALGCVVAVCIGAPQAQAQFVCIGNANGAPVPPGAADGAGAVATGAATVACGTNATANGLAATATGAGSRAEGTRANATGAGAIASGQNATAIGTLSL